MSTLEQLVPSLALCQKLKAAGFPQDTALVWVPAGAIRDDDPPFVYYREDVKSWEQVPACSAPTAEEILRELPRGYNPTPLLNMVRDWYPGKSLAKEAAEAYLQSRGAT